ncbi:MAG: hypothetical protein LRS48_02605 [Desulfurococcales archaeon]|nr:hypothetical protein [Desulfurococcales archaeon]
MCRLIAGVSSNRNGSRQLAMLARALVDAARRDPYLERLTGGKARSHCHGYGYVLITSHTRGPPWRVRYEKFDSYTPGEDRDPGRACRSNLERLEEAVESVSQTLLGAERAYLILHARRAGRREPRGTVHAHPYHETVHTRDGPVEMWLAHNGGLKKDELAGELGVEAASYTDTGLLAAWIARRAEEDKEDKKIAKALGEGYKHVKSAYIVAVLTLASKPSQDPGLLLAVGLPGWKEKEAERADYYRPLLYRSDGIFAYASSTVEIYGENHGLEKKGFSEITVGKGPKIIRLTKDGPSRAL